MTERGSVITDDEFLHCPSDAHIKQSALFFEVAFGVRDDGRSDSGDEHLFELTPLRSVQSQQVNVISVLAILRLLSSRQSQKIHEDMHFPARFFQQGFTYLAKCPNLPIRLRSGKQSQNGFERVREVVREKYSVRICNAPRLSRAALRRSSQKMKISFFERTSRRPTVSYAAEAWNHRSYS